MSTKIHPFGFDFGNGDIGSVTVKGGVQYRCTIPTAFLRVDAKAMRSLAHTEEGELVEAAKPTKGKGKSKVTQVAPVTPGVVDTDPTKPAILEPDKIIIQMQGESIAYALGNYALTQGGDLWDGNDDNERYASEYALKGLLASAALLISEKDFSIYVVTGIPAKLYIQEPGLRQRIKAALEGTYTFTLDGGYSWRTISVEIATVIMEGAGALLAYPGVTKTMEAAIIDIGSGTCDLYAQSGTTPILEFCKGTNLAVANAENILKETFLMKKIRELTEREVRQIMRAFASGKKSNFPVLYAGGDPVPVEEVQDMVEEAVRIVGRDIASFIARTWKDGINRFSLILVIGGGVFYFFDAVKNRIEHVKLHDDPVFANPRGYVTLAARKLIARQQVAPAQEAQTA